MDGLSLLCNLHADGPLTLQRLRHAGVRTLRDLERVPEATLASWLGSPRARRFVEEARQLAGRLAEAPLEPEESPAPELEESRVGEPEESARAEPRLSFRSADPQLRGEPPRDAELRAGALAGLDLEICARLNAQGVRTFAALVEQTNLTFARRAGIPFPKLLDLSTRAQRFLAERPVEQQRAAPRSERPSFGSGAREASFDVERGSLRAGAIDGLEAEICERLSAHGVRTFAALVAETSLALARRTGIPYPKLLDLSSRARSLVVERELRPEPARRAPALEGLSIAPPVRTTPSIRAWNTAAPTSELAGRPDDPGVAGPFG